MAGALADDVAVADGKRANLTCSLHLTEIYPSSLDPVHVASY
jgi:hypothetical protein